MNSQTPALLRSFLPAATVAALVTLTDCSTMPVRSSRNAASSSREYMPTPAAALGTAWGETRDSRVTTTTFERAHTRPDGVGELRYNDVSLFDQGRNFHGRRELAGGRVAAGVKNERGRWLPIFERDGPATLIGGHGARYEIVVRNLTPHRIEVVVSVDGLDVLDGRSASYSKRGHLIGPRGAVTIPGWRTSSCSVAAFRFAAVEDSYAAKKHGDTRNMGVIGVAVFTEKAPPMRVSAEPPPGWRGPNPFPGEHWARPPQS
jgi:hypothetical protein